jgi:N-acetylmuramoyl-L-alanine amidase
MRTKLTALILLSACILIFNSFSGDHEGKPEPFVVVLDAGHGGRDPGNRGNGYTEKDIVLDVTLQVGKILEKQPGFKVIYTRKTDVFIELYDRGPIANKVDADVFVSIHCNSHHTQAFGVETFVMGVDKTGKNLETAKKENEVIFLEDNYEEKYAGFDPHSPESFIGLSLLQEEFLDQSILLAGLVQENLVNNLNRKDRSVKSAPFWVLHSTYMPSILIELGFLTHKSEGPYVDSKKGRREMSEQIANGIIKYRKSLALSSTSGEDLIVVSETIDPVIEGTKENVYDGIIFKVQLAASSKELDPKPYNFKGLEEISRSKEGGLYKYYYGGTSDYAKIQSMKIHAQQSGFPTSYIVAFKDGKKVILSEILHPEDQ